MTYTFGGAAKILDIAESKLRYWAQVGFVGPSGRRGGKPVFTFQDLVSVKAAKELVDRGFKAAEIRKAIDGVRASLPHIDRPLDRIRVAFDGTALVVVDEGQRLRADRPAGVRLRSRPSWPARSATPRQGGVGRGGHAGAVPLADAAESGRADRPKPRRRSRRPQRLRLVRGRDARRGDGRRRRATPATLLPEALALDPGLAAARTNLGSLAYRRGDDRRRARRVRGGAGAGSRSARGALQPGEPGAGGGRSRAGGRRVPPRAAERARTSPTRTSTWRSPWNAWAAEPRRARISRGTSPWSRNRQRRGQSKRGC